MHNDGKDYGGESVFKYLVSELVDNIYQHSEFENAYLMAQRYPKKEFVEICFFDDGITIPGCFRRNGHNSDDCTLIQNAIRGFSTKGPERGFGLSTNLKLFTKGLNGQILIVSGKGAYFADKINEKLYKLRDELGLSGTLISIRIPCPVPEVDIYEYVEN